MAERAGGPPPSSGAESGSPADSTLPNGSQAPSGPVDCGTRLRPAGTEASQPGKAACLSVRSFFLGLFLSRSDQCAGRDQDTPVIFTISPGWLEVRVVLSP